MDRQFAEALKQQDYIIETPNQMTFSYKKSLEEMLLYLADTELTAVFSILSAYKLAPTINHKITCLALMQDELGHALIAYQLLRDLGIDTENLLYERRGDQFNNQYAMDFDITCWEELGVYNMLYDTAGYTLLRDSHKNSSYGPWKRSLKKVEKEEIFHLRNGRTLIKEAMKNEDSKQRVQSAVDWMFLLAYEFFGTNEQFQEKTLSETYRFRLSSNDELRQQWFAIVVPFFESVSIRVPAAYNEQTSSYMLTVPYPCHFDVGNKKWDYERLAPWTDVIRRFVRRGPDINRFITTFQSCYKELASLRQGDDGDG
ncbi:Phenylacetic acid catabolic protein [Paenibacillus sp. UMB4589-SE434]|uniref:Phenylacetic acid catabolic protein n=1 Tax=Paenibacillus sp. UMB4589-SE434 TaxID=3046314 RepID=UPI00254D8F27|nr:Phenylacetic acid catabolic protein [Paenibacillus sp. UMB4589-SE434]MDK8182746.1 phenylacetate-CoA oxygenase subunit PaaI [Paenibacillus sp. UMB4589-SE434]